MPVTPMPHLFRRLHSILLKTFFFFVSLTFNLYSNNIKTQLYVSCFKIYRSCIWGKIWQNTIFVLLSMLENTATITYGSQGRRVFLLYYRRVHNAYDTSENTPLPKKCFSVRVGSWFSVLSLVKGVCKAGRCILVVDGLIGISVLRQRWETWTTHKSLLIFSHAHNLNKLH